MVEGPDRLAGHGGGRQITTYDALAVHDLIEVAQPGDVRGDDGRDAELAGFGDAPRLHGLAANAICESGFALDEENARAFAAMRADKEEPATPPPITIRSKFMFPLGKDNSQRYYFRGGRQIKRPRTEVRG